MTTRPLRLCGTGIAVPARAVTAEEVDVRAGLPAGWTRELSGVAFEINRQEITDPDGADGNRSLLTGWWEGRG